MFVIKMVDYTQVAHEIIDVVEAKIREVYPIMEQYVKLFLKEYNTLFIGEVYYDLENKIVDLLKTTFNDTNENS